ncbi:MAG: alpha-amylase family glycosyl hydrolase, partial [Cyclobacteriaceae bacterium]
MRGIFISLLSVFSFLLSAQVVVTDPFFPSADGAVTVTFNAEEGSAGLADYGGDVYVHTGVITNNSTSDSDWKYVKTAWGENTTDTRLTRDETNPNLYYWSITPSPEDYYGVPEGETILRLAFVFRSGVEVGNGYLEGKAVGNTDIFVEMSTNELQLAMSLPAEEAFLVNQFEEITVKGHTSVEATFNLYIDEFLVNSESAVKEYEFVFEAAQAAGTHEVVLEATDGETTLEKSFTYTLRSTTVEESRPSGIIRGINYDSEDDTRVTLCLQAPNKSSVYVIGDFNNWEVSTSSQMKKDGEFFWLEITGLTAGTEYAFQYLVDETILVPDPYADKILDGFNDQWIPETIYPGLMEFPEEAQNANWMYNYASVLETGQTPFNWTDQAFEKPDKSKLVIYELLIRDFFDNGEESYQNLTDTLSYLKNLGVNAIELMPVTEYSGNDSWGYNPTFMFAPDKAHGPKEKLKEFINTAHENGIAVILDMVLNQQDLPSPLLVMDWNSATGRPSDQNPYFNNSGPHENGATHEFSVFYDLNHLSSYTQSFVDSVNHYWINEYHFDGYRFDLSKGFMQTGSFYDYNQERIDILDRMDNEIKTYAPDAYVILEHLGEYFEEIELSNRGMMLWGIMHEAYKENILGTGFNDISRSHHAARGFGDFNLIGYMESHDEQRQVYDAKNFGGSSGEYNVRTVSTALERVKLASAFLYSIPGPKMLWQFGELGYD